MKQNRGRLDGRAKIPVTAGMCMQKHCAVIRAQVGGFAGCGVGEGDHPIKNRLGALVESCGERRCTQSLSPMFRKDQSIQQYPMVRDGMLGKAAIFFHQFFNAILQPFPSLAGKVIVPFPLVVSLDSRFRGNDVLVFSVSRQIALLPHWYRDCCPGLRHTVCWRDSLNVPIYEFA